jgi:peroxiredoxin
MIETILLKEPGRVKEPGHAKRVYSRGGGVVLTALLTILLASCGGLSREEAAFKGGIARLEKAGTAAREQAHFRDSLDVEGLYASPWREGYVSAWVASFTVPDSVPVQCERLLGRVAREYPARFKPLVADICRALKARGAGAAAAAVAVLPHGIDAAQYPAIAARLLVATLLPGQKAPALVSGSSRVPAPGGDGRQTILFFYASDCRACQAMISEMIERYDALQKARTRVITLSTDTNRELFAEYARKFPWDDKLCDLKGFSSPNMIAYGVAATPTLYLVDGKGTVAGQYETVDELWEVIF